MRLKIPVGVAYGSDVTRVMQIMMECATENKSVLRYPAPRVLFLQFGESSLDFELRVWIGDFADRRLIQSELNQAIDRKFRSAEIEIPFPQRDLHLRSIDESATSNLESSPAQQLSLISRKRDDQEG
jgi:small-conductance mechanosensitive channel